MITHSRLRSTARHVGCTRLRACTDGAVTRRWYINRRWTAADGICVSGGSRRANLHPRFVRRACSQRCSHLAARAGTPSVSSRHARSTVTARPRQASSLVRRRVSAAPACVHATLTLCIASKSVRQPARRSVSTRRRSPCVWPEVPCSHVRSGTWHAVSCLNDSTSPLAPCASASASSRSECKGLPQPAAHSTCWINVSMLSRIRRIAALYSCPARHRPVYMWAGVTNVVLSGTAVGDVGSSASNRSVTVRARPANPANRPSVPGPRRLRVRAPSVHPFSPSRDMGP